jgi:L-rhamnose-H+ transport protein
MLINLSVLPIVFAGLLNGSFVIPARYIKNFFNEQIWFYHSIIGLAIIPWVILAIILPHAVHNYLLLQPAILIFLIFGGAIFGLGQICFASAIESIGVALSFAINLGIGVTIGSMFVVFYKGAFFTEQGYLVTLAVLLIICSLIISYFSGKNHNQNCLSYQHNAKYHAGWLLASLTGVASGLQNITFVIVAFHSKTQFQTSDAFWVWPPFLLAAAIPMLLGFLYKAKKKEETNASIATNALNTKNIILLILMGLFFTGSLALYSDGMSQLTHQQQIIGWPAFMVSIILASQLWGWLYREANGTTIRGKVYMLCSVLLLVVAIILLAIEA